jgi:hypothetical protein
MGNMSIRQGSQLPLSVAQGDETSVSATVIFKEQTSGTEISETELFVDGLASIVFGGLKTGEVGIYDMQVNENFTSESPLKYPDPDSCDGDCEYPTLTICESLDPEVS